MADHTASWSSEQNRSHLLAFATISDQVAVQKLRRQRTSALIGPLATSMIIACEPLLCVNPLVLAPLDQPPVLSDTNDGKVTVSVQPEASHTTTI